MKPTNQEVFERGDLLEHCPCDWDPVNEEVDSNGSIQATYEYKGRKYALFHPFEGENFTTVFNPDKEAELIINED
jgi:GH35 family endo-1,4-beta-xylanase